MYKDLLVLLSGAETDRLAVDAATSLAAAVDGHVTVLDQTLLPTPSPSPWGLFPDVLDDPLYAKLREVGRESGRRWSEYLARSGAAFDVRTVENFGNLATLAGEHALYSDLAVMALPGHAGSVEPDLRWMFGTVLLRAHRPVLVVPGTHRPSLPPSRVVVGWKPTPAAARALLDAMPLLERADAVDVVLVRRMGGSGDPAVEGSQIAAHLARHGIRVELVVVDRVQDSTATTLLRHCAKVQADLLVCGGYGHLRMSEWAFGGVTRELLTTAHLPVLMSH